MKKLQPLGNNVILKPLPKEEKTKGGIILPDTNEKEEPEEAKVLAVGPGKPLSNGKNSKMQVSEGNKVLFKKYSATEVKIDGDEYLVVEMGSIMAIIEE